MYFMRSLYRANHVQLYYVVSSVFFFTQTEVTEIYTLSLHDALPIWPSRRAREIAWRIAIMTLVFGYHYVKTILVADRPNGDRKSTRLNSSHTVSSYAVFCLKKKSFTREPRPMRISQMMGTLPPSQPT